MRPNKDAAYCDGSDCARTEQCARYKGHYEFDQENCWSICAAICKRHKHYNFLPFQERKPE